MSFDFKNNIHTEIDMATDQISQYLITTFNNKVIKKLNDIKDTVGHLSMHLPPKYLDIFVYNNGVISINPELFKCYSDADSLHLNSLFELIHFITDITNSKKEFFKIIKAYNFNKMSYAQYNDLRVAVFNILQEDIMKDLWCGYTIDDYMGYYAGYGDYPLIISEESLLYTMEFLYYFFSDDVKKLLYIEGGEEKEWGYCASPKMKSVYRKWLIKILTSRKYTKIAKSIYISQSFLLWIVASFHNWKDDKTNYENGINYWFILKDNFTKYTLYDWANCLINIDKKQINSYQNFQKAVQKMKASQNAV